MKYSLNIHEHLNGINAMSKNFFFVLAFMLIGTSFATNEVEELTLNVGETTTNVDYCIVRKCIVYKGETYCTAWKEIDCADWK